MKCVTGLIYCEKVWQGGQGVMAVGTKVKVTKLQRNSLQTMWIMNKTMPSIDPCIQGDTSIISDDANHNDIRGI